MRSLSEFSLTEWLRLVPIQHALKQARNDGWLAAYNMSRPKQLRHFLADCQDLKGKNVALVIAFELPWVLDWQLQMASSHLSDMSILVFDNSRDESKRIEIKEVCKQNNTPYFALPPNSTTHVNRSHGMAMSWVYHNIVRAMSPRIFGFIDHDMIPIGTVTIADKLVDQSVYGLLNQGRYEFWSLWAGYCFFNYASTEGKNINFLYDFSRDLDTGGRNWEIIYRELDRSQLRLATSDNLSLKGPTIENPRLVQFIDKNWLHIGGISYSDNSKEDIEYFKALQNLYTKK
jgi:hypothetical protein